MLKFRHMPPTVFQGSPERVGTLIEAIAMTGR